MMWHSQVAITKLQAGEFKLCSNCHALNKHLFKHIQPQVLNVAIRISPAQKA
jgi:cytochrome c2